MVDNYFEKISHRKLLGVLFALSYIFLMMGNGFVSLTHPDEVFYVQSAKEMVARNSWWTPIIFDWPHFEKPIFCFWLLALSVKFFGPVPFAARFWPALFGMIGVGVTYWTAWMLFGRKRLAFLSGFVLSTSLIYLALSRAVLTDMVFSIWVALAIALFYWGYTDQRRRDTAIVLCAAVCGIAVLTKGVLGLLFPGAVILIFLLYKRDVGFLVRPSVLIGGCLFLAVAVPWHWLMYKWYGNQFLHEYVYNVHIRRVLEAEHARLDNWYFYLWLIFAGVLPWSFFWPPAGHLLWKQFREKTAQRGPLFFLLAWIVGVYMLVQPAHSKLASYIFPVFPAIAILLAFYLDNALEAGARQGQPGRSRTLAVCGYIFTGLLVVIAFGAIIAGHIYKTFVPNPAVVYIFAALLFILAVFVVVLIRRKDYTRMIFAHAGLTTVLLVMIFLARPVMEPWVSCKGISDVFQTIDRSGSTVLTSKFYVRGIRFYTDRKVAVIDINGEGFFSPHPIPFLNTDRKVLDFLATQPVTYAIVKEGNVRDLKRIVAGQPYRLQELQGIGGKFILRIAKI
ncbi:MAG: glycosyltransferase family 39 protein [Candidatus Omnitrophica bacterium]|nr:glycosyltransferase family 39 protein [Candidatus Omnitrophota bacterium]